MSNLSFKFLTPGQWPLIEQIERGPDFNEPMPTDPQQTGFLAALDGDRIAGHMRIEHLYHLMHVHVAPEYRAHGELAMDLMRRATLSVPAGFPYVWMTRKPYPRIVGAFDAEDLGQFNIYRRKLKWA